MRRVCANPVPRRKCRHGHLRPAGALRWVGTFGFPLMPANSARPMRPVGAPRQIDCDGAGAGSGSRARRDDRRRSASDAAGIVAGASRGTRHAGPTPASMRYVGGKSRAAVLPTSSPAPKKMPPKGGAARRLAGGRCRVRTCDPCRVKPFPGLFDHFPELPGRARKLPIPELTQDVK